MVDYGIQIREASVVIEAACEVRRKGPYGGSAIAHVRSTVGLEAVNANVRGSVQIPSRLGPERFCVTVVTASLATKQFVAASGSGLIERHGGIWRRDR